MANENDSPERIAADILIAVMENGSSATRNNLCKPEPAAEAYQTIFNTVLNARAKAIGDA
ncbi:MAG: hypothetical protein CMM07_10970 [Rhodopirellula sp.]|nr:hypothetical protein [Rhodopirellula sp.]